jgi:hypothetical protein
VLLPFFVLAVPFAAYAQIYRWTDDAGHGHYTEGIDTIPERYRSRAVPMGLVNRPVAPSDRDAPSGVPANGAVVPFAPGERILVEAMLNGRTTVRLLLDTGADRTLISPKALGDAGVSFRDARSRPIIGVTGQVDAQAVAIDSLEVQQARVTRIPVIAFDMNRPGVDGLLGRDFLDRFHVTIDSGAGTVTIRPR